jgi:signal transduction histidine kinase
MFLSFSHLFVDVRGSVEFRQGALFSLPPELTDNFRLARYQQLKGPGWHKSEFGYETFIQDDHLGNRFILPGLYLVGGSTPNKKFYGYKPAFTREQIENYLTQHIASESEIRKKSELELTALVHDLRHLSTSIYHSALEAKKAVQQNDRGQSLENIETVIASQTMLRVRIDYLDFANSVDRFVDEELIPVYGRVDKVIRCFRASARHKGIDIRLAGESYRLAKGPNILDIAPYTLIENAIKYAPENTAINVAVSDGEGVTNVSVKSLGPLLKEDEYQSIFRRGFRGDNAMRYRSGGTGLGLAVANSVVDIFGGSIGVQQSGPPSDVNGIAFRQTDFTFSVPTPGEDTQRRAKFRARTERPARLGQASSRL